MAKLNGWEETICLVLILGENVLLIVLSNAIYGCIFYVWYTFFHFPPLKL